LFVIVAVGEFALVNNILVRKTLPPIVGHLIDDYFQWTTGGVVILGNILYWPAILPNDATIGLTWFALVFWMSLNGVRIYWNYKNEKKGWAFVTGLIKPYWHRVIHEIKEQFFKPPPKPSSMIQNELKASTSITESEICQIPSTSSSSEVDILLDKDLSLPKTV